MIDSKELLKEIQLQFSKSKNPKKVQEFIKQHENQLSNLSVREGLKAINRSKK
ncbi:DNA alkylation repair protein [Candidatus Babeliales bacterium]|nr:DNA alkylation repair protein [Candidatus Babeliales bacterium]